MTRRVSYEVREFSGRLLNVYNGEFTIRACHEREFYTKLHEHLSMRYPSLYVKIIK
jgi:hypothetical protein